MENKDWFFEKPDEIKRVHGIVKGELKSKDSHAEAKRAEMRAKIDKHKKWVMRQFGLNPDRLAARRGAASLQSLRETSGLPAPRDARITHGQEKEANMVANLRHDQTVLVARTAFPDETEHCEARQNVSNSNRRRWWRRNRGIQLSI